MKSYPLYLLVFALGACSSPEATGDGGATDASANDSSPTKDASADAIGADAGGDGASVDSGRIDCSCAVGESCIAVTVTRGADDSAFPWKVWPDKADGKGTLIVSAYHLSKKTTVQERVVDANFTSASASYAVSLLCVAQGENYVNAYLDDNVNVPAGASMSTAFSSDYPDSCAYPRSQKFTVTSGSIQPVALVLGGSCD